jgi:hypothetical protein
VFLLVSWVDYLVRFLVGGLVVSTRVGTRPVCRSLPLESYTATRLAIEHGWVAIAACLESEEFGEPVVSSLLHF